jgi:hypothetical protein
MERLPESLERRLVKLGSTLVDHRRARLLVAPAQDQPGFWFGAGNLVRHPRDHRLLLIGRYRDPGDSRSGLGHGARGRELALLHSTDEGQSFTKIRSWDKSDLYCGSAVLSIEGSALRLSRGRVEVLVSTEKVHPYPRGLTSYQKPGTGVWSIDTFSAPSIEALAPQEQLHPLLHSQDPSYLHLKDPSLSSGFAPGQLLLLYCAHPFGWTSSTSGYALLAGEAPAQVHHDFFPRGPAWDVAACRVTCRLPLPRVGAFAKLPRISLYFYDGAECLRPLESHRYAMDRPRGYSCEELGGLAYGFDQDFPRLHRLSQLNPLFVSPEGTRSNRYVSVLDEGEGGLWATWQRSVASGAQPLFLHHLKSEKVRALLA